MSCSVELPENSCANATKQATYNMPNNIYTSLKTSGTKSFRVMRPKLNYIVTNINATFREESRRPMTKSTQSLLGSLEVDL